MVCHRQHLNILVGLCRGVLDVPLAIVRPFVLYSELHHHFQDNQDILHRFDVETSIEFLQNELLHKFLTQSLTIASSLLFCFFSAILKDYRFFCTFATETSRAVQSAHKPRVESIADDNVELNCSMIKNIPPKRVGSSDLICIFAMTIVGISCLFCKTKTNEFFNIAK